MGASGSSRSQEPVGEYLSRKIAAETQTSLDEYMANNPEFPVSSPSARSKASLTYRHRAPDRKRCFSL